MCRYNVRFFRTWTGFSRIGADLSLDGSVVLHGLAPGSSKEKLLLRISRTVGRFHFKGSDSDKVHSKGTIQNYGLGFHGIWISNLVYNNSGIVAVRLLRKQQILNSKGKGFVFNKKRNIEEGADQTDKIEMGRR